MSMRASLAGGQSSTMTCHAQRPLAAKMARSQTNQIARLGSPDVIKGLVAIAALATRVCCLALRVCYAVAWHVYCVLSDSIVLLKRIAESGHDCIRWRSSKDVLFAVDVESYERGAIEHAQSARQTRDPDGCPDDQRCVAGATRAGSPGSDTDQQPFAHNPICR